MAAAGPYNAACIDGHSHDSATVSGVQVRRSVIVVEHLDHDGPELDEAELSVTVGARRSRWLCGGGAMVVLAATLRALSP